MQIKILTSVALLCTTIASFNSSAQTNWYWTKQADSAQEYASYDAVDRNNNVYYTGYCMGTRIAFGNIGLYITGSQTDFLAKYNANGNPLWARNGKALSNLSGSDGMSVATDRNNNVIETGYLYDSVAFGSFHLSSGATSNLNTYLVKYNANGNVLWATSPIYNTAYPTEYNQAYSVATDLKNNILVTGYFQDTIIFSNDTLITNSSDMFLAKYNSSGNFLWAKAPILTSGSSAYGYSAAVDDSGNSYVAGNFSGSVTFGPSVNLFSSGTNIYLAKYDSSGNAKWAIDIPATPNGSWPTPVTVDKSGNVYVSTQFNNTSLTIGSYTVTDEASPCSNSLLAKFDHNGNPLWATCANFISSDEVCVIVESSIATDRCNNVYWSGLCSDTFAVGNVNITVPGGGANPSTAFSYVIKFDSNGNPIGGMGMPNQNTQSFSSGLAIDSFSRVLFDGTLYAPQTMVLGSDTVNRYLAKQTSYLSKFSIGPSILNSNKNNFICPGDSDILTVAYSKGTTYKWSTGATTTSIIVKPLNTTTYFVAMSNNCNIDTGFIKIMIMKPTINLNGSDSVCRGDSIFLIAGGGVTYKWSTGQTTNSIKVAPASTTTYTLSASNGICNIDTTFQIIIKTPPNVILAYTGGCTAQTPVVLKANVKGIGPFTYVWSPGGQTTDSITVTDNPETYTVNVSNSCGKSSSSSITVTPDNSSLSACCDTTIQFGDSAHLNARGVDIFNYEWTPTAGIINCDTCPKVTVSPTVTTTYTVTGIDSNGCTIEKIIIVTVEIPCADLTIPNVFTPNYAGASGLDNEFYVKTTGVDAWVLSIYDRWGKEMFKTTNPSQYWKGFAESGDQVPDGVYYYIIDATCQGITYKKDGFVQVIK